jgi:transcriptional/translational regulatory protein YebC/TACO1
MFNHICNFRIKSKNIVPEEIELEFIDYGLEEIEVENNEILLYAPFNNFGSIQKALELKEIEIISSSFERIPKNILLISSDKRDEVLKLIEKIEEDEDVQNVYSNIDYGNN